MTTPADVLKMIKEKEVKFVDFRFTDTRGKEQHVGVPVSGLRRLDKFEDGHAFDGSSIAGWKGIQASDMLLMPDAGTAYIDPFMDETTLILTCDVVEPSDGKGYDRDPRSHRQARRGLPEVHRHRRHRLLRPRARVLHLRRRRVERRHVRLPTCKIDLGRGRLGLRREVRRRQHRPPPDRQGRLLPGAAGRQPATTSAPPCAWRWKQLGVDGRSASPRSRHRRPVRDRHQVQHAGASAPTGLQILKYIVHNVAHSYGKTATFMPKPIVGDNGSGMHVHQSIWKDGKNLFAGNGYAGLSEFALYYIGGIIKHARALNAITNPRHQLLQAPGARLRSPGQAGLLGAQPLGLDPHPVRAEPTRRAASRCASRIRPPTPTWPSPRMMMAGLDGMQNKIHPGEPADKNLYDLPPEEDAKIPTVCSVARPGAGLPRQGPRVPDPRRRVHQRHDRRLHRAEDGGSHALPHDHPSGRVRHVLQPVKPLPRSGRVESGRRTGGPSFLFHRSTVTLRRDAST